MNEYEGLFIIKSNLNKDEMGKISSAIADIILKNGGKVGNTEHMGIRQLGYEIKKQRQGHYLLVYFTAQPKAISGITKSYKLNESILRAQIFKRDIASAAPQVRRVKSAEENSKWRS